jgi:hypothetical protein
MRLQIAGRWRGETDGDLYRYHRTKHSQGRNSSAPPPNVWLRNLAPVCPWPIVSREKDKCIGLFCRLRVAGGSFINLTYIFCVYPFIQIKNVYCIGSTLVQNSSTSQLRKQPCRGASASMLSSILFLQFTAQDLASRKFWYLTYTSMLQVIDFPT